MHGVHSPGIPYALRRMRRPRLAEQALGGRLLPVALTIGTGILLSFTIVRYSSANNTGFKAAPFLASLLVIVLGLGRERAVRNLSVFSPLTFATAVYFVMFVAVPLADLWFGNPTTFQQSWWPASWLAFYGILAIFVGHALPFHLVRRSRVDRMSARWRPGLARLLALVLLVVAALAVIQRIGGLAALPSYLSSFALRHRFVSSTTLTLVAISLVGPAICLMAGSWLRRPTSGRFLSILFIWIPPALFISAYLGQRWRALSILIALAAIVHLGNQKVSPATLAGISVALVALFLTIGLQRNVIGTQSQPRDVAGQGLYLNYVGVGHELSQFRELVITLDGVPDRLPFQSGKTFLSVIPNTSFPTSGFLYSSTFFPELHAIGSSVPTPLPGELYLNFGVPGILIGMLLYGAFLGMLEMYFHYTRNTIGGVLIYSYSLLPVALILRGDFTTFAGWYGVGLIGLVVALRFVQPDAAKPPRWG
ncbi:MAG: O-antigen polysaccharide polymerase Wzy [Actinobacteria bacterium]|nr:O-antigen polysaccharide polymerase Wzy [Actinomycetota bacterium]